MPDSGESFHTLRLAISHIVACAIRAKPLNDLSTESHLGRGSKMATHGPDQVGFAVFDFGEVGPVPLELMAATVKV
jgi:hypothetical protein